MRYILKINLLFTCLLVCLISKAHAGACDPTIANNYPGNEPANFYGNGQTDSFRCAITGSTDLTSLQQSERADLIPQSLNNRFYVLLGANASTESITSVKNESIYDPYIQAAVLTTDQTKTASNNVELAFGYTWKDVAIDLQWLAVKSIAYSGYLTQINPSLYYNSTVKGDATLINVYWIFQDLYNFKFYGLVCGGISSNKSTTTLNYGTSNVIKKMSPAYGLGFGARFNLVSNIYADMAARYIILGRAKFAAVDSAGDYMILKGYRTWLGVSARILWLI